MGSTVRHLLRALDCWRAPQDAAQDLRLAGCIVERLGKLKSFCEQSPQLPLCGMQSITKTSIQSTKTLWQRQTCWQREEQEQKGIEPRSRTTTNRPHLSKQGSKALHLGTRWMHPNSCRHQNLHQVRLHQWRLLSAVRTRNGCSPCERPPRPKHDARGHKVTDRKGRSREWTAWHQEFASSDQVPRKGQKAPRRGFRATEGASSAVDGSPCCRNPGVGGAIERLPQASDPAYRSGKSSPNRDQCDQQDHPTTQQPGSRWNCLSQSTGTFPHRGGRLDGGCC